MPRRHENEISLPVSAGLSRNPIRPQTNRCSIHLRLWASTEASDWRSNSLASSAAERFPSLSIRIRAVSPSTSSGSRRPPPELSESDDVARTGPRHGGKVRGRSRAEEIRHIVIELENAEPRIANRRQPARPSSDVGHCCERSRNSGSAGKVALFAVVLRRCDGKFDPDAAASGPRAVRPSAMPRSTASNTRSAEARSIARPAGTEALFCVFVPKRLVDRGRDELGERKAALRSRRGCTEREAVAVRDFLPRGGGFERTFEGLRERHVPLKLEGEFTPPRANRRCRPWVAHDCGQGLAQGVDIVHVFDRNASVAVGQPFI